MTTEAFYRAERARQLLDDPIVNEAFDRLERVFTEEILKADATDDQRRVFADRVNAIRYVRAELLMYVQRAKPPEQQQVENLP